LRGRFLQALARRGARLHDVRMLTPDKLRAGGEHRHIFFIVAQMAVGIGEHRLHLRPFHIELLGDQHRGHRFHALPGFRTSRLDDDFAVRCDPHESQWCKCRRATALSLRRSRSGAQVQFGDQPAGNRRRNTQEIAS